MWWLLVVQAFGDDRPCQVRGGWTSVRYVDVATSVREEQRLAAAELREPRVVTAYAVVTVQRTTIELADPTLQTVIGESGGVEVARFEPSPALPQVPGETDYWSSTFVVTMPSEGFPVTMHVVDRPTATRCSWTLPEAGAATRTRGGCRWPDGIQEVASEMEWVQIDGETIEVVGRPRWSTLAIDLRDCGMVESAETLERWRKARRLTNIMLGISAGTFWPIVSVPFTAGHAGKMRRELEEDLVAGR